jgi:hypothetical protein
VPLNNQKQAGREAAPVDNGEATSTLPWWRSKASVMLVGAEFGVSPAPGEAYMQYKDRVYQAWRAALYQARNKSRDKSANQR